MYAFEAITNISFCLIYNAKGLAIYIMTVACKSNLLPQPDCNVCKARGLKLVYHSIKKKDMLKGAKIMSSRTLSWIMG